MLDAVNGSSIRVIGETVLQCQVDDFSFELPCLVTDQVEGILIGLSWLEQHDVMWSFGGRSIQMNGRSLPVQRQPNTDRYGKMAKAEENCPAASSPGLVMATKLRTSLPQKSRRVLPLSPRSSIKQPVQLPRLLRIPPIHCSSLPQMKEVEKETRNVMSRKNQVYTSRKKKELSMAPGQRSHRFWILFCGVTGIWTDVSRCDDDLFFRVIIISAQELRHKSFVLAEFCFSHYCMHPVE